jgi:hypothetical protein
MNEIVIHELGVSIRCGLVGRTFESVEISFRLSRRQHDGNNDTYRCGKELNKKLCFFIHI